MDCVCLRKKHRKKRQHSKFRHMTPPVSPVHSQPSSLGHNPDARLPKVNSTGLWMGAPSMYAGGPAPAYYMGRGVPYSTKVPADPRFIARASSETRIAQSGFQQPVQHRPFFGSQSNLLFIPSQSGQRIYHSQQLTPLYEVPVRNGGMDIYDVYQFGGFSKSKLAESKHTQSYYDDGFVLRSKLERSKSDLGEKTKHGRRSSEKSRQSSHHRSSSNEGKRHRSSSRETDNRPKSELGNGNRMPRSANSFKEASQKSNTSGQNNRAFSADGEIGRVSAIKEEVPFKSSLVSANGKPPKPPMPTSSVPTIAVATHSPPLVNGTLGLVSAIVEDHSEISPSATDSMKLLAKNKTDDQKTIVPPKVNDGESNEFESKSFGHQHYFYHGDIYAISGNRKFIDGEEENPIISRMKDMVIEKSRNSNPSSPQEIPKAPFSDTYSVIDNSNSEVIKDNYAPIYEEIKIEKKEIVTKEVNITQDLINKEHPGNERSKPTGLPNLANLSVMDGFELPPTPDSGKGEFVYNTVSNDISESTKDKSFSEEPSQLASPIALRVKETSLKGVDDVDGANEEISTAGKRITDSAFEFLNTYLSDEEGADGPVDSPPLSPSS